MRKPKVQKFLNQYNRHFDSISKLIKKHRHQNFIGFVLNLLEGVSSVERLARDLQRDYNVTFKLIDDVKDANAKLFKDLPEDKFNKVTSLFAELNFLISRRLHEIMVALYHNREIPLTKLPTIPVRKLKRSRGRTIKRSKK